MRFTEKEIVFLTSVSRGRIPFGITWHLPEQEKKEKYIRETTDSLKGKGILATDGKLTKEGAEIIYLFEQYRNCKRHVRLNHVNMAVLPGDILITMIKTKDGYEAGCIRRDFFMTELLKHADYLCLKEEKTERGRWESVEESAWINGNEDMEGCILIDEYDTGHLESEKIYYWKEQRGFLYHRTRGRLRTLSPGVMRKQIYKILERGEENGQEER